MPIVSGAVVSEMNSTSHVGNIRLLRPVVVSIKPKKDNQAKNDHTKDAEEPEEPLGIVTEILEILLMAYNVLIINVNYEDKMAKETN